MGIMNASPEKKNTSEGQDAPPTACSNRISGCGRAAENRVGGMEEVQERLGRNEESDRVVDDPERAYRSRTVEEEEDDDEVEDLTERTLDEEDDADENEAKATASSSNPSPPACRSVRDFDGEGALRMALMQLSVSSSNNEREDAPPDEGRDEEPMELREEWDWVLHKGDKKTSVPQSVAEEVKRLMVLNSYQILDAEREASFDKLTAMAARMYDVPIALVSLVDIGRQWFMSHHGLPPRQTPRKLAFCAHAIQSIHKILIVNDATQDQRFYDSPLVTGPPNIRFYAGAPLISPEGYKLGTFCIIDNKPWPNGLSAKEQETLHDMASMTVQIMDDRRKLIAQQKHNNTCNLKQKQDPVMAAAAYDQLTPLAGLESSLEALANDKTLATKLDPNQQKQLTLSVQCCDVLSKICHTSCQQLTENSKSSMDCTFQIPLLLKKTKSSPHVRLRNLFHTLQVIGGGIPKQVPLQIKLSSSAPSQIVSDELVLTRCSLNLLSRALAITTTTQTTQQQATKGNGADNAVSFEIFAEDGRLYFQCEYTTTRTSDDRVSGSSSACDTSSCGGSILSDFHDSCVSCDDGGEESDKKRTTTNSLRIFSLASQMESIGGEYGVRRRDDGGGAGSSSTPSGTIGYISWFSIPIALPKATSTTSKSRPPITATIYPGCPSDVVVPTTSQTVSPPPPPTKSHSTSSVTPSPAASVVTKSKGKDHKTKSMMEVDPLTPTHTATHTAHHKDNNTKVATTTATKKKALVIEDSAIVRKCLCRGFQKLGFEVSEAGDGIAGFEAMKRTKYDIILCDFVLPQIDGIECVTRYRDWETKQNTASAMNNNDNEQCIIGIATQANSGDIERGLAAGMNAFQAKPITTAVLRELVENLDKVKSTSPNQANHHPPGGGDDDGVGRRNCKRNEPCTSTTTTAATSDDNEREDDDEDEHTSTHRVSKRPKLIDNDVSPLLGRRTPETVPVVVCQCEGTRCPNNRNNDSALNYSSSRRQVKPSPS